MISLINKSNKVPLVRLASTDSKDSIKIIEAGASGIVIPQVKNVAHVKKIIDACNYPPLGSRGIFGFSRANRIWKRAQFSYKKI